MGDFLYEPILEPTATLEPNTTEPAFAPETTQPAPAPNETLQPEGRGTVVLEDRLVPPSLFEKLGTADGITPTEHAIAGAALRAFDRAPLRERTYYVQQADQADATTGNLVLQLFEVPAGMEARLTQVTVDTPQSATINPTAPFASASAWQFIALAPPSSTDNDASAAGLRPGLVAFAPTSAGGPILPGQWTFHDSDAPVGRGGMMFYYVLIGGSVSALQGITIRAACRVNLYSAGAQ